MIEIMREGMGKLIILHTIIPASNIFFIVEIGKAMKKLSKLFLDKSTVFGDAVGCNECLVSYRIHK